MIDKEEFIAINRENDVSDWINQIAETNRKESLNCDDLEEEEKEEIKIHSSLYDPDERSFESQNHTAY